MNTSISYLERTPSRVKQEIDSKIETLEASETDVIKCFCQCAALPLTYIQEQRIFNAYVDGDTSELGLIVHELMQNQITEMAKTIS